nr:hypothetical protein [Tanacetum cinerariifolium]
MASRFEGQELEINSLKARIKEVEIIRLKERIKFLEDKDGVIGDKSIDDAPIKGRSNNEGEAPAERISNDSEEIARVLTSMDATTVLAREANVPTGSGFIPTTGLPATIVSTGSKVGLTASPIVQRRKGKEIMEESDTPKKKKLQEQIDAQVARELEEQQEREDMRMNKQIARDAEVARIHTEEEIQGMIDSLDKSNETVAKYLQEHQQFASDLSLEKKIELISDLVKYQEHYTKVYKFQSQQRKLISKKQKREYYMAVIKSYLGWRFKDFKERVKILEDKEGVIGDRSGDGAPIKGRSNNEREAAAERISNDSEEILRVLTFVDAATVLAGETNVPTSSGFILTAGPPATRIRRATREREDIRMNKQIARYAEVARIHTEEEIQELPLEKKIELKSDLVKYQDHYTKVQKFQSQQRRPMAKKQKREYYMAVIKSNLGWRFKDFKGMTFEEIEAKFVQIARDVEVARIHAEEEIQGMIDSLDKSNETIAKYLQEYQHFALELPLEKKIELISDRMKYQEHYTKHIEDFIPIGLKEETKRLKRKGLNLEKEQKILILVFNIKDDEEEEDAEFVKASSSDTNDEDETKIKDKTEGNILNQVIKDAHVTLSNVLQKAEVLVTSCSHSFDLASKFLNFSNIPDTDAEIVSPMDVYVHHESEELEFEVPDSDMPQDQEENLNNPEGDDYPFDLTKPLPLVMDGNRQMVPVYYFFNNDLKYLQGGISTMTYTTSITNTKATQYDLPGIEDMVRNIWSHVKVAYDKHALWEKMELIGKKAHIMIKAIDKQLKERRMMSSFEKFVGGRHYETDRQLLQRPI